HPARAEFDVLRAQREMAAHALHGALQSDVDTAMRASACVAYVLLGFALVASLLGPRGQRAVNAAMRSAGVFACAFFGLRGVGHAWVAPVTAVIAAVLAALFGVVADAWGTAALLGGLFAAAAGGRA